MDELEAIRQNCKVIAKDIENGWMPTSAGIANLAGEIDTLAHWVIQIAKKLEMV